MNIKGLLKLLIIGFVFLQSLTGFAQTNNKDFTKQDALDFLKAYMPLSDIADYDEAFLLLRLIMLLRQGISLLGEKQFLMMFFVILFWFIE